MLSVYFRSGCVHSTRRPWRRNPHASKTGSPRKSKWSVTSVGTKSFYNVLCINVLFCRYLFQLQPICFHWFNAVSVLAARDRESSGEGRERFTTSAGRGAALPPARAAAARSQGDTPHQCGGRSRCCALACTRCRCLQPGRYTASVSR